VAAAVQTNRSSLLLGVTAYGALSSVALAALAARQLDLVGRGTTEARRSDPSSASAAVTHMHRCPSQYAERRRARFHGPPSPRPGCWVWARNVHECLSGSLSGVAPSGGRAAAGARAGAADSEDDGHV
jgi:hypothetical protein